jgi:dTDP-4-dehydrorhamnose reductase
VSARKKFFITGARGQVGWELSRALLPHGEVYACDVDTLDLLDEGAVRAAIRTFAPDAIVNGAAYTAVDRAEEERELAMKLNAEVPGFLAEEAERLGALIVHYSTDYVFGGFGGGNGHPWAEDDEPDPVNYYGVSKLAGDVTVAAHASRHLIFRTSWLYASRGKNFLRTLLRFFREKNEVRVVDDQTGAPTWARFVADATVAALTSAMRRDAEAASLSGVYNLACRGETTWFGFADAIRRQVGEACAVLPIASEEYPTSAARPAWSVLSTEKIERTFGIRPPHWEACMRLCLDECAEAVG